MGCSCAPSPALTTDALPASANHLATCAGTPAQAWRTTKQSAPMASIVSTVSRRDSPLLRELDEPVKVITSAESRLAAVSKDSRVRVESSKNVDTTVLPRNAGTLGMDRWPTSTKVSASRMTSSMPSAPKSATLSR